MTDFLDQVSKNFASRKLLARGESLLIAVSGGVDSMVLLHVLNQLALENSWKLAVAHLNHQLRGRSSNADERLVIRTAERLKIPVVTGQVDVEKHARTQKLSIEMAAREKRHEFLARTAKRLKISTIALAHHADDQVELFFLRLLRGSGSGLSGMKWKNRSPSDPGLLLVRPLLDVSKAELLKFAAENKIPFREDTTNASIDFERNRIRHELLPLLRKNYQPSLNRVIRRAMEITAGESDFVLLAAEDWLASKNPSAFSELHVAVQRRSLQIQLQRLGVSADFELIEALRAESGLAISAGTDVWVSRTQQGQVQRTAQIVPAIEINKIEFYLDKIPAAVSFSDLQISWRVFKSKSRNTPKARKALEIFDAEKIGNEIILRHWQPGDRFQPIGMSQPVKLQDIFINLKIPRARRHQLVVATTKNGELFWVEGLRISELFKVSGQTIRRLLWCWKPR